MSDGREFSEVRNASLASLRERVTRISEPEGAAFLLQALREDPRRGAGDLARLLERRLARERAEAERLRGLFALRDRLRADGVLHVAGVDEVGVGPLAGPVVAAAVVLPDGAALPGLDDSKRLSPRQREALDVEIRRQALAFAVAEATAEEIDRSNVLQASLLAMRRAVLALSVAPDHVLVDARTIPGIVAPQTAIVGGDGLDASIAAASVVAKVHRDGLMRVFDTRYPGYGFARHKGYPTPPHLDALRRLGPCPLHRRSYAPVAQLEIS
ncbi:MAG: ribonuclease HII [Myxococcota bacterium]